MFKVFMQGDKKYVTIRILRKLFQSHLWGLVVPWLYFFLVFFFSYFKEGSSLSLESFVCYSCLIATMYLMVVFIYFRLMFYEPFLEGYDDDIKEWITPDKFSIKAILDFLVFVALCFCPSHYNIFCRCGMCCKEELKLFHMTLYKYDKEFCYFSFFCYRIKNSKDSINKTVKGE